MEGNPSHGNCRICNGTMSIHINVDKPLDHKFERIKPLSTSAGSKARS